MSAVVQNYVYRGVEKNPKKEIPSMTNEELDTLKKLVEKYRHGK